MCVSEEVVSVCVRRLLVCVSEEVVSVCVRGGC